MTKPSRFPFPGPIRGLFLAAVLASGLAAQDTFITCPLLPQDQGSIQVFDSRGRSVGRILPQRRCWTPLDRIPEFLRKALLAVEDANFYEHGALDVRGIARALVKDATKGRWAEGGSTITQQLIKNKFLTGERSLDRKMREARLALDFEKQYTKNQILEMYFNEIHFGQGTTGIAQAARLYFDKRPEELSPAEGLLLAGVPKNPSRYNPFGKVAAVAARRDVVLNRMVDLRLISPAQRQEFWAHPAAIQPPGRAPQVLGYLRTELASRLGVEAVERGGLDVFIALDLDLQNLAEESLRRGVKAVAPDLQGALVCLDPATGDVLAAVGDVEGSAHSINRAFTSRRQPGSAIKPLIYAAALEKGITASSLWSDEPVAYDRGGGTSWTPRNYGGESFGELPLRQALAHSDNVITVKVLEAVGVPEFVAFSARMGLPQVAENGLSLGLGTFEVTLKDLVQAYTPLAAGGIRAEARLILRIHDHRSQAWSEHPPVLVPVLEPDTAFITTAMLKDVLVYGTAKGLRAFSEAHPCAGKTGTTDAAQDAWFIGYTPRLLTGIWVGRDRPRPGGRGFTGGAIAAPIWGRFMARAQALRPGEDFPRPDSVVGATIDPTTGLLATEDCPRSQEEWYRPGTEPTETCPAHGGTTAE